MLAQPWGESCEHPWLLIPNRLLRAWLTLSITPLAPSCTASCIPHPTGLFGSFSTEILCSRTVGMRAGKPCPAQPGRGRLTRPALINLTFTREAAGSNLISRETLINHRLKLPR